MAIEKCSPFDREIVRIQMVPQLFMDESLGTCFSVNQRDNIHSCSYVSPTVCGGEKTLFSCDAAQAAFQKRSGWLASQGLEETH